MLRPMHVDDLTFSWDPADPDGFRTGQARLGAELGARRTSATVYELPPGQAVCPYHKGMVFARYGPVACQLSVILLIGRCCSPA